jgi:low temperature requirement protein LtrA
MALLRLQEAGEGRPERHATWTELFFDLVFVVAVAQLAAGLQERVTVAGAGAFVGLFVPVAWAWVNYAFVADLFDADEGLFRLVLLAATLGVAALAATIPAAFDGHTAAFIIAWACLRADLVALYAWAWRSDPGLRPLVAPHAIGFGMGLAVWLSSLAFPAPGRYLVWICALAIDLATGLVVYLRTAEVPRHRSHMPERFGLFTLIVLGESIIAVSGGTAGSDWALDSAVTAALGFSLAAALWWLYFARFDERVFDWALAGGMNERRRSFAFGYGHLIVFPALAAIGVGVQLAIEASVGTGSEGDAAAVLATALACYLIGLSIIQWAAPRRVARPALIGRGVIAAAALALAGLGGALSALVLVGLTAAAGLAETAFEGVIEPARAP